MPGYTPGNGVTVKNKLGAATHEELEAADLLGLKGIVVRDPDILGAARDEALPADRPVIMNICTDPNVPTLPPHITLKDARNVMTMTWTEPEPGSVLMNSARRLLAGVLPGRR